MIQKKPLIAISSCLMGEKVRFDGGHKKDQWILSKLAPFVDFLPLCPEMAMGLGTPRETMRLERSRLDGPIHLISNKTKVQLTQLAKDTSRALVDQIPSTVNGYIFKNKSPSCGLERVKVYTPNGMCEKSGVGFQAKEFIKHFPLVPVCEEGHLNDQRLKEEFVIGVFTHFACQQLPAKMSAIQKFQQDYKFLIMAFNEESMRKLGRIVANNQRLKPSEVLDKYQNELYKALKSPLSEKKRTNVIQHMFGFLKKIISSAEKKHIQELLTKYRNKQIPYVAVVSVLNHLLQIHDVPYIKSQVILEPYPKDLEL